MRRNVLDLRLHLAQLAARLNAAARRRFGHALLNVRPFRTPEALPVVISVAMYGECAQPGTRSPKGRDPLEPRNPFAGYTYRA